MSDDLREMTVTEAGALAGVSAEVIRNAIRAGTLPIKRRIGVSILLDRDKVEAWAEARVRARDAKPGKFPGESS